MFPPVEISRTVRVCRSLYLCVNGLVLPLGVLFAMLHRDFLHYEGLMMLGIYILVPFWLVYFLGMGMYHFPLKTGGALSEILTLFVPFILFLYTSDGNWLFSFYSLFFTSFAGFTLFMLIFIVGESFSSGDGGFPLKTTLVLLAAFLFAAFFVFGFSGPFIEELRSWGEIFTPWIAFIAGLGQIGNMAWGHYQTMKKRAENKEMRDKIWEKSVSKVAAVLILSLCATLFLAIFLSPENQTTLGQWLGDWIRSDA